MMIAVSRYYTCFVHYSIQTNPLTGINLADIFNLQILADQICQGHMVPDRDP